MTGAPGAERTLRATLRIGELHVWVIGTADVAGADSADVAVLDASERARLLRLQAHDDRARFVRRRVARREILAAYAGVAPSELAFTTNRWGRPVLAAPQRAVGLRFNESHSGDIAVIALAAAGRIGVDVERLRPMVDGEAIAGRFFAPAEATSLAALPAAERTEGFFNAWTRKEAVVKALGAGLSIPLDAFEVTLRPGEPAVINRWEVPDSDSCGGRWHLHAFDPAPGYIGALAFDQEARACRVRTWPV